MVKRALTIDDAAEYLNRSPWTLRHWRATQTGPRSYRAGRRVVWDISDLDAWLDQQRDADQLGAGAA